MRECPLCGSDLVDETGRCPAMGCALFGLIVDSAEANRVADAWRRGERPWRKVLVPEVRLP